MNNLIYTFSLLLFSILIISCNTGGKDIDMENLVTRDSLYYEINTDTPYSGQYTGFFKKNNEDEEGKIEIKGEIKDGLLENMNIAFYQNGQKKEEKKYSKGKLNGLATNWLENGQVELEVNYSNNEKNGEEILYYENGQKKSLINYSNGLINGIYEKYHNNGVLALKAEYNDDAISTIFERNSEDGSKITGETLKDGRGIMFEMKNKNIHKILCCENRSCTNAIAGSYGNQGSAKIPIDIFYKERKGYKPWTVRYGDPKLGRDMYGELNRRDPMAFEYRFNSFTTFTVTLSNSWREDLSNGQICIKINNKYNVSGRPSIPYNYRGTYCRSIK